MFDQNDPRCPNCKSRLWTSLPTSLESLGDYYCKNCDENNLGKCVWFAYELTAIDNLGKRSDLYDELRKHLNIIDSNAVMDILRKLGYIK